MGSSLVDENSLGWLAVFIDRWETSHLLEVVQVHVRTDVSSGRTLASGSLFDVVEVTWGFNLLVAAIIVRVEVPARELSNLECLPNYLALSLRDEDLLGKGLKVPSIFGLGLERLEHFLHLELFSVQVGALLATNTLGQVIQFVRVVVKVEQLWAIRWADGVLPGPAADHHQGCNGTLACVLGDDSVMTRFAE